MKAKEKELTPGSKFTTDKEAKQKDVKKEPRYKDGAKPKYAGKNWVDPKVKKA